MKMNQKIRIAHQKIRQMNFMQRMLSYACIHYAKPQHIQTTEEILFGNIAML